jgi:hypothetical protein
MNLNSTSCPQPWCALLLAGLGMLLIACNSTTVFQADFNSNTVASPPAFNQQVGTITTDARGGTVLVVDRPAPGLAGNWVKIGHQQSRETAMTAHFSTTGGAGRYGLLAKLFIPSDAGVVTVQFEPFSGRPDNYFSFMHLDFMPENDIRVDDGTTRFGRFPRDRAFLLSVSFDITATSATVHVSLSGPGASGSADLPVNPRLLSAANGFSAVKFWMGTQYSGSFYVDDILVTRRNS